MKVSGILFLAVAALLQVGRAEEESPATSTIMRRVVRSTPMIQTGQHRIVHEPPTITRFSYSNSSGIGRGQPGSWTHQTSSGPQAPALPSRGFTTSFSNGYTTFSSPYSGILGRRLGGLGSLEGGTLGSNSSGGLSGRWTHQTPSGPQVTAFPSSGYGSGLSGYSYGGSLGSLEGNSYSGPLGANSSSLSGSWTSQTSSGPQVTVYPGIGSGGGISGYGLSGLGSLEGGSYPIIGGSSTRGEAIGGCRPSMLPGAQGENSMYQYRMPMPQYSEKVLVSSPNTGCSCRKQTYSVQSY